MKIKYITLTFGIVLMAFLNAKAVSNPGSTGMTFSKSTYQVFETGTLTINMGAIGGTAICPLDAIYSINIPRSMHLNQTTAELQASLNSQTGGPVFTVSSNTINGAGTTIIILTIPNGIPGNTDWDLVFPVIGFAQSGSLNAIIGIEPNASCAGGNLSSMDDNQLSPVVVSGFLPISLSSFNANLIDCKSELNWTTSAEENFKNFVVEVSSDGKNFQTAGVVSSKGKNGKGSTYSFKHEGKNGSLYYRLKSVDHNGSFSYSNIINVNKDCNKRKISLYPNPATEFLTVDVMNGDNNAPVNAIGILYNSTGKEVSRFNISNDKNYLDVSKQPGGVYILKISGNEIDENHQLIIE